MAAGDEPVQNPDHESPQDPGHEGVAPAGPDSAVVGTDVADHPHVADASHVDHAVHPQDVHDPHHDAHPGDHGHEAHAPGGDAWVLPPLVVGVVLAIIVIVVLGIGSGASPLG
jgi:hypothetical protein